MSIMRAGVLLAATLTLAWAPDAATAQSSPGQPPPQTGPDSRPAGTILNRDAPITEQEIRKNRSYRSRGVGERNKWNLDIGGFSEELKARPEELPNEPIGNYSGFRFRVPLKGRQGR